MIVIDAVQRAPELFSLLRHLIDTHPTQRYLLLGSASLDLIKQSSESLAGRIGLFELGGLRLRDVGAGALPDLWLRGGLPPSLLAGNEAHSSMGRREYIATFLERGIPQIGIRIPARTLHRFWTMIENVDPLHGHPKLGASREGFALEAMVHALDLRDDEAWFWATHADAALDLLFHRAGAAWGADFKFADAPRMTRAMHIAFAELELRRLFVVYPGRTACAIHERVQVVPVAELESLADRVGGAPG